MVVSASTLEPVPYSIPAGAPPCFMSWYSGQRRGSIGKRSRNALRKRLPTPRARDWNCGEAAAPSLAPPPPTIRTLRRPEAGVSASLAATWGPVLGASERGEVAIFGDDEP